MTVFTRHSDRMREADEGLHAKTGTTHPASPTPSAKAADYKKSDSRGRGIWKWGFRLLFLAVAALTILHLLENGVGNPASLVPTPSVSGIVALARNYWFVVIILASALFWVAGRADKSAVGLLRTVIVATVLMLFFDLGFGQWTAEWYTAPRAVATAQPTIPLESQPLASWGKLIAPPGNRSRFVRVPNGMSISMNGLDFEMHCTYEDGRDVLPPCPKGIAYAYAKNKRRDIENIVSYAFQ